MGIGREFMLPFRRSNRITKNNFLLGEGVAYSEDGCTMFVPIRQPEEPIAAQNSKLELQPNVQFRLSSSYRLLVDVNPKLYEYGQVQFPRVIEPGEEKELKVHVKFSKECNLGQFDYLVRLYLVGE